MVALLCVGVLQIRLNTCPPMFLFFLFQSSFELNLSHGSSLIGRYKPTINLLRDLLASTKLARNTAEFTVTTKHST